MKRVFLISSFLFFIGGAIQLFAHGKGDVIERPITDFASYQEFFELTSAKTGKYNVMVRANDQGGNTTIGGPFNIYVDPESDLPVSGITNPSKNMRVPGNLNIVGTCIDDDAVDFVTLILDDDVNNPIIAEGKEFWSYYLDTTELTEGPHKIEVFGTDINGLKGRSVSLTWHLDRRQPVTAVTNYGLGVLVSGKIDLKGTISDGNGIKSLHYSLDGGEHFYETKISENKREGAWGFSVPIDTKQFPDGPSVCWFKATDKMGSTGIYSFLYFIDNTVPDLQIISPANGEVQNGKFTVAGFAKDVMGMQRLSWEFAGEKGDFELIPGNPYWYKEVSTIGLKDKSAVFVISGTDVAGNDRTVKRTIPLDQEADRPIVTIDYPQPEEVIEGGAGELFIRGMVVDDDAVSSIVYSIDDDGKGNVEQVEVPCEGAIYTIVSPDQDMPAGHHILKIVAKDVNGVESHPVLLPFSVRGARPEFSDAEIRGAPEGNLPVTAGMLVHPETDSIFTTTATSEAGLVKVEYKIEWGPNGEEITNQIVNEKGNKPITVSLPIKDLPWGLVRIKMSAEDIYGRITEQRSILNVRNLHRIYSDEPKIVFEPSEGIVEITASRTVVIYTDESFPASGYFVGGIPKSVEIVPSTPFAKVRLDGNTILFDYGNAQGKSMPVRVKVTTDQNLVYESLPIVFQSPIVPPEIILHGAAATAPVSGFEPVKITGRVTTKNPLISLQYRIFSAKAEMDGEVVTSVSPVVESGGLVDVKFNEDVFEIDIDAETFPQNGMYAIEIIANNGIVDSNVVFVNKIPPLPATLPNGKKPKALAPVISWFDGFDVYHAVTYQGHVDKPTGVYKRNEMPIGTMTLSATIANEAGKTFTSKYTPQRIEGGTKIRFESIGGEAFSSGMDIILPRGGSTTARAIISSDYPVGSVTYKIEGEQLPGGNPSQTGRANLKVEGEHYSAEFPIQNIPAGLTKITLTAENGKIQLAKADAVISVLREANPRTDDERKIYWAPSQSVIYDPDGDRYICKMGENFDAYANAPGPVTAEFVNEIEGLHLVENGNIVSVVADDDGIFKGVAIRVKDSQGAEYVSSSVTIFVNTAPPECEILSPENCIWVQDTATLSVAARDATGIDNVEYSLDGGENWNRARKRGDVWNAQLDLESYEEGMIPIDVRVTDGAGTIAFAQGAIQKDVTPPEVSVIVPCSEDIVNGENAIVFKVTDNGKFIHSEYFSPSKMPESGTGSDSPIDLAVESAVAALIGTKEAPISDLMSFGFTDAAGNQAVVRQWDFIIDPESDLPRAEVHLPEEDAVITRDFEISGVIYDDDGPCKLFYKLDEGEWIEAPEEGSSFSMDILIEDMVDNEHKITVYAEDIHGVRGPEYVRNFRVSLEEPKGAVLTPEISETVRETITLTGNATDENGIKMVYVSFDNGNSYNEVIGEFGHEIKKCDWEYTLDTRVIQDGTHVVFLKIVDWYGIEGMYSAQVNIDNTPPEITLELPVDDSKTSGMLFFSGNTIDNIELTELYVTIRSLEGKSVPEDLVRTDFVPDAIITQGIDLTRLRDGFYNVEITGKDAADNITRVSRNIQLDKEAPRAKVDLLYPLNGESVQGVFNVYGTAVSERPIQKIQLFVDEEMCAETELTMAGYFKFRMYPELLADGQHTVKAIAVLDDDSTIESEEHYLIYNCIGPWVTIDEFTYGNFAFDRPFLFGEAGYAVDEEELVAAGAKTATKEYKAQIEAKSVAKVEISFNNGKTFKQISKNGKWRYRIENGELAEGYHFLLLRALMNNGEVAVTRMLVQIDKTPPIVRIIAPSAGGRYNQVLDFSGLTSDDVALKDVSLFLRKGDKSSYEVPKFIQGLYFDWQFWGASLFNIGMGLTFFDDNVKIQFQWGQFTREQWKIFGGNDMGYRYGGDNIMGIKLLANVFYLPFNFMFGPDFDWLSANFALGANFSYFSDSGAGKGQFLSALLGQIEFPRISLEKQKMFRTIAIYTEGQIWLIPSDVSGADVKTIVPQISFGMRLNVF